MSRVWPVLAMVALLWPARTLGWLDGIPLNGSIEAVLIGLAAPALWWLDRGVFSRKWAQLAVVALIVLKAGSLAMTPQGLCGRFFTAAPFRGEISTITIDEPAGVLRSWDVRADMTSPAPACTAIVDRPYPSMAAFPAWFVNLVDYITPGQRDVRLDLSGFARVGSVPVARRVPESLVLVAAGASLGAFFAHAHGYPGRFSIHAVPLASALAIAGVARSFRR
ncbi:MAG: hypothetical protein Q7R30_16415 [Acidobacteriota bacterium]|nr:hypothetical protein [Acidobacteriota bacterium]